MARSGIGAKSRSCGRSPGRRGLPRRARMPIIIAKIVRFP